ncbi:MAG: hypothetical protein ACU0CA_03640 [Paracoccaceae bacterium]
MKPMLLAFITIVVIAVASNQLLQRVGFSSQDRNAGADVRLGDS